MRADSAAGALQALAHHGQTCNHHHALQHTAGQFSINQLFAAMTGSCAGSTPFARAKKTDRPAQWALLVLTSRSHTLLAALAITTEMSQIRNSKHVAVSILLVKPIEIVLRICASEIHQKAMSMGKLNFRLDAASACTLPNAIMIRAVLGAHCYKRFQLPRVSNVCQKPIN